jgi:predicted ABC-type ATPase
LSSAAERIRDAIHQTPCGDVYGARFSPRLPQAEPIAVIVAGPAGAGKTTVYTSILPKWFVKGAQYANVDVYAEYFMEAYGLATDAEKLSAVIKGAICTQQDLKRWMTERRHLIIDKPCDKAAEARALVRNLRAAGYDVYMLVVTASKAQALSRNRRRTRQVPDAVVEAIWQGVHVNLVKGVYAGIFKEAPEHLLVVDNEHEIAPEAKKQWEGVFPASRRS